MSVKTMRYEIVGWAGDPKSAKARWRTIADQCREIVNVIWQQWETWHVQRGDDLKCRDWLAAVKAWHEADKKDRGDKPKLDVQCMPPELSKLVYASIKARFPTVHTRTWGLLQQLTAKRMGGKDVEGRYNIWLAVLLNRQGRPNSTHQQPIPFDSKNSRPVKIIEEKYTNYRLRVSLTRLPSDKKNSPSIEDEVQLKARGSGAVILSRIESGEYRFCGSSIVYHEGKHKWYALVAYKMPDAAKPELQDTKATIWPCKDRPWRLMIGGRDIWVGGGGSHVAAVRRQLLTQRWSRQENYRRAGSSNKGHGRKRALDPVFKLSNRWRQFAKCYNEQVTAEVIRRCVDARIGTLIYLQPMEAKRDNRFLVASGKVEGRQDSTGWDWAQFGTRLAAKASEVGIHVEVRKCGGKKKSAAA